MAKGGNVVKGVAKAFIAFEYGMTSAHLLRSASVIVSIAVPLLLKSNRCLSFNVQVPHFAKPGIRSLFGSKVRTKLIQ